jgi:RimJ/RimL family protein N-acetyltransferase
MVASADELLSFSSVEERNRRFFAQENPIPLQAIRYGGEEGRFVGCISLTPRVGAGIVDLGYYLHPIHQRKGVMVAAGAAVVRWARDEFGVTRVYSRYVSPAWQSII